MSRTLAALLLATGALLAAPAAGAQEAAAAPTVRLYDADLDEARQLAVESAASRGWSVVSVEHDRATLEQALEPPGLGLDRPADTLVRVRTEFLPDGTDIVVRVQAIQIDSPGTPTEHTTDVTDRYRDNLTNALRSLQGHWASRFTVADPPPEAMAAPASDLTRLGTWAYYAERYAEAHGCRLADEGATLVSTSGDTEVHRVPCRGGGTSLVRCHLGECTSAR